MSNPEFSENTMLSPEDLKKEIHASYGGCEQAFIGAGALMVASSVCVVLADTFHNMNPGGNAALVAEGAAVLFGVDAVGFISGSAGAVYGAIHNLRGARRANNQLQSYTA